MQTPAAPVYRFGPFEVDPQAGALLKQGKRISLQEQPFRLLIILLEKPGEVVTRAEIQSRIWAADTFVDFDSSLRVAVGKLRAALGDDANEPRYIETIPRRGYRFLGPATQSTKSNPPTAAPDQAFPPASSPNPNLPAERTSRWARTRWFGVPVLVILIPGILVLGILTACALLFFHRPRPILTERDTVVLGNFANSTGDPVFDETLRQGLAVALEQSPYLALISDGRIRQTLQLMDRSPDAQLTGELAREVCERTGSAAVLEGSIARLGSQYVLGLRAENCRTGEVLAEEQVQAAAKEDVLHALSDAAGKLRARLGESLRTLGKYNAPLQEVTTSSLPALKYFTAGGKVGFASGSAKAIPFLQHAIEIDPRFAMAYSLLGRYYGDIGESQLSAEATTTAYQLRDHTSDEERFWITANYDTQVLGNLKKAAENDALWLQAYPRAAAPHGIMAGTVSIALGDYTNAIHQDEIAVTIDPDFLIGYITIAQSDLALGNVDAAQLALQRPSERKLEIPDLALERYAIAFLKGDQPAMATEVARAAEDPETAEWLASGQSFVLSHSGRLAEANRQTRKAEDLARASDRKETVAMYETDAALREALFGMTAAGRNRATAALNTSRSRDVEYAAAVAFLLAGDSSREAFLANELAKRFPEDTQVQFTMLPTLRALAALKDREPARAIEQLQTPLPYELGLQSDGGSELAMGGGNLFPAYVRGEAYLAAGQGSEAAREFKKILDHRGLAIADPIDALAHLQLARAYRLMGDKDKARRGYNDFLGLWKDADRDIPCLQEARKEYARL